MRVICIVIAVIFGLSGCTRKIDCADPLIQFAFISFPPGDIDTLIIRRFPTDNNFQSLIDTFQVNTLNSSITSLGDTAYISLRNPDNYIKPGYDWQVFIPSTNRTLSITKIVKKEKTGKCGAMQDDCFCYDEILSLKVDNQTGILNAPYSNVLYIR